MELNGNGYEPTCRTKNLILTTIKHNQNENERRIAINPRQSYG